MITIIAVAVAVTGDQGVARSDACVFRGGRGLDVSSSGRGLNIPSSLLLLPPSLSTSQPYEKAAGTGIGTDYGCYDSGTYAQWPQFRRIFRRSRSGENARRKAFEGSVLRHT